MKIVLLTTDTLHHAYFLREIARYYPLEAAFAEERSMQPPFETHHPFEDAREEYESRVWFGGRIQTLRDFGDVASFPSVNDPGAVQRLRELKPDITIVFGTGKIGSEVISTCAEGIINLHGGDPELYRGLDSHLWAIYHEDYPALVTTLHKLNEKLDDGDVILQSSLSVQPGMGIHMLRRINTEACVSMTLSSMDMYSRLGFFVGRRQRSKGRYYSFMPKELKSICKMKFERYTGATH